MLWGESPLYEFGNLRRTLYQMITLIGKVLDEGNCGRATDRGEEACEDVRKLRVCIDFATRTSSRQSCEATNRNVIQGRVGPGEQPQHCKAVPRQSALVNDELVQRNITHPIVDRPLSGETCRDNIRRCRRSDQ